MGVVSDWLYKGADAGTKAATQNQVKNLGWGQIAKNVWNEGGYGFGKNNMGFDPNYKGSGATKNPLKYAYEAFKGNKARGNIGGGTTASRQLFEKILQSPVGKYGSKVMPAARYLATGPVNIGSLVGIGIGKGVEKYAEATNTPQGLQYMKDMNKADPWAYHETDLEIAPDGNMFTRGSVYDMERDRINKMGATPIAENDLMNYNEHYEMLPEEEKEGFLSFLQNAGVNTRDFLMNNAARYGGAMGGAQLGSMFGPIGSLAGMIAGGIFGNKFTNQPYIGAGDLYHGAGGFTAAQLDRQNALGGYYSDAARNQRRNASRVANLIDRAQSGGKLSFSRKNLRDLGGFTDKQIDDIVGGSTQISPGTFTAASIDQSFSGEEGPSGGTSSGSRNETGFGSSGMGRDPNDRMATGGIVGLYR